MCHTTLPIPAGISGAKPGDVFTIIRSLEDCWQPRLVRMLVSRLKTTVILDQSTPKCILVLRHCTLQEINTALKQLSETKWYCLEKIIVRNDGALEYIVLTQE